MDGGTVARISEGLGWTDEGRAEGVVITFVREKKNIDIKYRLNRRISNIKAETQEKNYTYQRMVGGCQWVLVGWFVSPMTALVEAASRTPTRSTQVDPSAMEDSYRSPPPLYPAGFCSVDLRREAALWFLQTHDSLFVSAFKPFRKSTNSSAPHEQSQGFPSSLIRVDLRDLKT